MGLLTKVQSSVSTTEYTSFDILGRVTGHKQTTDSEEYETDYTYNLSGALIEQTYPSGRKVKNVIDSNGYLSMVQSAKCLDSTPGTNAACTAQAGLWNYAKNFTYNAAGAVTSMQLGNNRWESTVFNSRLQPTQIGLGVTPGATNLLKLDYGYGTTQNNGNVLSQTITVPTVGQTDGFVATQSYEYDSLNRLKAAEELIDSQTSWKQTFTFDRYGNRNFDEANTTFTGFEKLCNSNTELCSNLRKILNPSVNQSNNRLSSSDDYEFDSSGNTTSDPQGRTFIYDAENKQIEVKDSQQNVIGQYRYDGDGKRIKKIVPGTGEVTVFVYSAGGQLVAEYSTEISQDHKVSYTTADHLGSPRILTDENGATISRRDFHPFGEEISASERAATLGYQSDDVRQKFTGYERDTESSLDFAQARMYQSNLGRFTGVDSFGPWAMTDNERSEFLNDVQRWNRFSYARGTPLRYSDPLGLYVCDTNKFSSEQCTQIQKGLEAIRDHGTEEQKKVARWLLNKKNKTLITSDENVSHASVNNVDGANDLIQRGNANVTDASEFLTIAIQPGNFASAPMLEGTLVHEGRHSWVQANIIAGFSNGSTVEDITQYRDEMLARDSAVKYFRRRGGEYTEFGQALQQLNSDGITVNQKKIREQIFHSYTSSITGEPLSPQNPGSKISELFGLKIKKASE